eukprot:scpid101368/ scgid2038/ 
MKRTKHNKLPQRYVVVDTPEVDNGLPVPLQNQLERICERAAGGGFECSATAVLELLPWRPADEVLSRGWKESCGKFLLYVSLCCIFCMSLSSDLTSGIPYAELLLNPCPSIGGGLQRNSSTEAVTVMTLTPLALEMNSITSTALTNVFSMVSDGECGGFGAGASTTG